MARSELKYEEIVERLNDMVETVAEKCIPDGRRHGNYWTGDLHGKCSVHIKGARTGLVGFWQGQRPGANGGDLIHLIQIAYGCSTHGQAVQIAKREFLHIEDRPLTAEEKREWARSKDESERKRKVREAEAAADREQKSDDVRAIWGRAQTIAGTLAERYLVGRGVDPRLIGKWPPSLRFHPALPLGRDAHPCLICGVQGSDRKLISIWRIFLTPDGRALEDREGDKIKLGLGPAAGGAVRLGPIGETLIVTEGVETGFGAGLINGWKFPVWAALSTSGMMSLDIPNGVKKLLIYGDGDRHRLNKLAGSVELPPGKKAAETLKKRAEEMGVSVSILLPPEPDDWLDVWNGTKK